MNPMDLRRGITAAVDQVVKELKKAAKLISTTEEIAQARSRLHWSPYDPVRVVNADP
jgi:chaperonin GroEL (HSP60 family)